MFNPIKKEQFVRSKTKPNEPVSSKRVSFKNVPNTTDVVQSATR